MSNIPPLLATFVVVCMSLFWLVSFYEKKKKVEYDELRLVLLMGGLCSMVFLFGWYVFKLLKLLM